VEIAVAEWVNIKSLTLLSTISRVIESMAIHNSAYCDASE